ncbi:MAG: phage virion morphogenesis protein [Alistipes sp.]|jgi:phage gpG-like protein|nr:phage virion morphogenesis protein [Alistipes sp.]
MTQAEFIREIQKERQKLDDLFRRKLPVIVGRMAKDHYQDNFRKGGFVNNGLQKWEPAKRITSGRKDAGAKYKTLMSSKNHLFSGIQYTPGDSRVVISDPIPYAAAHQFGEAITVPITAKMRRFAWAKHYEAGGGSDSGTEGEENTNTEASFWKGLALTKKTSLSIKLPARPFIGQSAELTKKIEDKIDIEVRKIITL